MLRRMIPVEALAQRLDAALLEAREIERLSVEHTSITLEDAYRIQQAGVRLREARGEKIIGYKMGLTSAAKRAQMGLDTSIYGVLTDRMRVGEDVPFSLAGKIHPKVEPEIGFVTSRELRWPVTPEEALSACSSVFAGLEILDSRYVGFKYFSLPDVVADNSSSAWFVMGRMEAAKLSLDALGNIEMEMSVEGGVSQSARSSEILGNPVFSLVELVRLLQSHGKSLPGGSIVLAGAATTAVQLAPGMRVTLKTSALPEVGLKVS